MREILEAIFVAVLFVLGCVVFIYLAGFVRS